MRKSLKAARIGDRKRVNEWRSRLTEAGGRFLQIPLDKKGIETFNRLKKIYKDKTNGELITFALAVLEQRTKQVMAKKQSAEQKTPIG